jgi:hemerythrin-like metal-binding protein
MPGRQARILPHPVWTPEFASGHPTIDDEHLGLLKALREIFSGMEAGQPWDTLVTATDALLARCRVHFKNEEELLRHIGYPGLIQHARSHEALLLKLSDLRNDFARDTEQSLAQVAARLHDLVVLHLLREDKDYFSYLPTSEGGD